MIHCPPEAPQLSERRRNESGCSLASCWLQRLRHERTGKSEAGRPPCATHTLLFHSTRPCLISTSRMSCSFTTSRPGSLLTSSGNHQTGTSKSSSPLGTARLCCSVVLSGNIVISPVLCVEHWGLVLLEMCPLDHAGLGELVWADSFALL